MTDYSGLHIKLLPDFESDGSSLRVHVLLYLREKPMTGTSGENGGKSGGLTLLLEQGKSTGTSSMGRTGPHREVKSFSNVVMVMEREGNYAYQVLIDDLKPYQAYSLFVARNTKRCTSDETLKANSFINISFR